MALPEPESPARLAGFSLEEEIPRLRGFVRRLEAQGDEAEEVLQETLARALRYRAGFDPAGSLGGWLRRTALHVLIDLRRRNARDPRGLGEEDVRVPAPPVTEPGAHEELDHALARLPHVERDVILRFHHRDETIAEIAVALAMPEGTVKSHLHRARHRLGEAMHRGSHR